ncbi:MAG: hypothetical protein PHQ14_09840 [Chromatiales bacterium]|nr:hypothetical protein [Chromatiales bacterium]MDX9766993.1 hypothetical protein [Ectothiorhodospiraceae bacterium]
MNGNIADVLIHIEPSLAADERRALEDGLRHVDGVIAPRFGEQTPHLLLVAYDPGRTDAASLLGYVGDRGHAARLVGM